MVHPLLCHRVVLVSGDCYHSTDRYLQEGQFYHFLDILHHVLFHALWIVIPDCIFPAKKLRNCSHLVPFRHLLSQLHSARSFDTIILAIRLERLPECLHESVYQADFLLQLQHLRWP